MLSHKMYKQRYVNKKRRWEIFLDDPNVSMWGTTHESLLKDGWVLSDEPLGLSDEDCPNCEGGKAFQTLGQQTYHEKCQACDGTGKKLL